MLRTQSSLDSLRTLGVATVFVLIIAAVSFSYPYTTQAQSTTADPQLQAAQLASQETDTAGETTPSKPETAACSGIVSCIMLLPSLLFQTVVTLLAGALIEISRLVLSMAGLLFNWLMDSTIIRFGTFYGDIKGAVETAWTAFRDIANIFIIGMFTFFAISIILGLKEYGQKKMIAHVLIIAVLINFSLLFTKMVIDASNYTATQIYTAAALGGTASAQGGGNAEATSAGGIADQFMYLLGVSTVGDSFKRLNAANGGWAALGHGIFTMIILLGAAAVLFYGCFLLISRMIMLIFLMATASIAFASYLLPKWSGSRYGWSAWLSSLLWCAAFAPMLMLLLWMTLNVSNSLKGPSNASLGQALADPSVSNISALFSYILVLGLLFGTFKISSMWAGKIGGFSMAQMAAALPFTMGSRFLAAPLLRQTAGYFGAKYQGARLGEMKDARRQAASLRQQEAEAFKNMSPMAARYGANARKFEQLAADKLKSAKRAGVFADGKMNLMDTPAVKSALGAVGVKGFAAGASEKDTKSYEGQQKVRAEASEKLAAKAAPSAADNEKAKNEARKVVRDQRSVAEAQLEATKRAAEANAEAVKQFEQLPQKLATAQRDEQLAKDTASQNKISLDQALQAGTITQAQHSTQMRTETDRIKKASEVAKNLQTRIDVVQKPVKDSENLLAAHRKETEKLAEDAAKTIVGAMGDVGENIAQTVGEKSGDILTRTIGSVTGTNKEAGEEARKLYKKKISTASLTAVMSQIQADSPPQTPPPTTP